MLLKTCEPAETCVTASVRAVEMPPPGAPATETGQGRGLIELALPYQLSAKTTYALGPDGVHCTIPIPVSASRTVEGDENA
ncbi:hypothetical protein [Pacificimonas flava]|uniref:Putative sensor histidine kinase n=1 Tax=Pacificimonas flava TaxID=1234595 RepID=M2T9L9_9SPHN|nr:hypothetical protein [Pacificimonas flava]EMD83274.1 putative sensor histidine kinase [Pacificimonas flava]MBB5279165.1 two-component system CheB/CheR fusion protein [Pacificimonas flava]